MSSDEKPANETEESIHLTKNEPEIHEEAKADPWTVPSWFLAIVCFVLGSVVGPPLGEVGKSFLARYEARKSEPDAIVCAPLQESRLIVRSGDAITHDLEMGFPNNAFVAFYTRGKELTNVEMLLYPISERSEKPLIYMANVQSSDLLGASTIDVETDGSVMNIEVPRLRKGEAILIDTLFGEPISYIVEVRADNYSGEFHGIAGCENAPETISTTPLETVFEYQFSACGENQDEPCGIQGVNFEFTIGEDGIQPTFEEVIMMHGERLYRQPIQETD